MTVRLQELTPEESARRFPGCITPVLDELIGVAPGHVRLVLLDGITLFAINVQVAHLAWSMWLGCGEWHVLDDIGVGLEALLDRDDVLFLDG